MLILLLYKCRVSNANTVKKQKKFSINEALDLILDIREYDISYYIRVSIDCGIFKMTTSINI